MPWLDRSLLLKETLELAKKAGYEVFTASEIVKKHKMRKEKKKDAF